jgi:hypothetical protein
MPSPSTPPRHHAWLLRCWEERGLAAPTWRFGLEDPHTGARRGFADLAALIAFIEGTLAGGAFSADVSGGVPHERRP